MKFRKGTKIACGLLTLFLCLSVAGAAFGAGQSSSDVAAVPQPDESTVLTFPHVNGFEDVIEWVLTFPHVDTVLTFPHVDGADD